MNTNRGFKLLNSYYLLNNLGMSNMNWLKMKNFNHISALSRRVFLAGGFSALIVRPARARIGLSAAPDLYKAFQSVPHIKDGTSDKMAYVLTTPWCPRTPEFFDESRPVVESGRMSLAWIPFSGGQPEGSNAIEEFFAAPENISSLFRPIKTGTAKGLTPTADRIDYLVATKLESLIIRDTGMGIKTPTIVYAIGDSTRIIPGSIDLPDIEKVAAAIF